MRPKVLSISPYAAGDPNLVVTSQVPVALTPLTLTASPLVFDTSRTLLLTFTDAAVSAAIAEDGGVFVDETTEANEATDDDLTLFPAVPVAAVDRYNIGAAAPFGRVDIDVSTVGTGTYTVVWEYFNGTIWVALSDVVDGTGGFKVANRQSLSFTVPLDWAATTINTQGPFFYIRAEAQTGTFTAVPVGQQIFIGGQGVAGNRYLITGKNSKGNTLVESVVNSVLDTTLESALVYAQIDEILPESTQVGTLVAGTTSIVPTAWIPLDYIISNFKVSLSMVFGGAVTPDFTVEVTLSNLLARRGNDPLPTVGTHLGSRFDLVYPTVNPQDHDTLVNVVADETGNLDFPVRAIRMRSNQVFTVEPVIMEIVQSGHTGR